MKSRAHIGILQAHVKFAGRLEKIRRKHELAFDLRLAGRSPKLTKPSDQPFAKGRRIARHPVGCDVVVEELLVVGKSDATGCLPDERFSFAFAVAPGGKQPPRERGENGDEDKNENRGLAAMMRVPMDWSAAASPRRFRESPTGERDQSR